MGGRQMLKEKNGITGVVVFLVDTLRELIELWDDDEVYYTKYADRFRALDDCRLCQNREGE